MINVFVDQDKSNLCHLVAPNKATADWWADLLEDHGYEVYTDVWDAA